MTAKLSAVPKPSLADGEDASRLCKAFGEALGLDEHALHFGCAVGCVIDVAELPR